MDRLVSDSACTATAYLSGCKANDATIGVKPNVKKFDCAAANEASNQLHSIAAWAQQAGKGTGFVTTTRVSHATPAGTYAHTSNRDDESDLDIIKRGGDPSVCRDIARQLVDNEVSNNFNVIMGGGAAKLLPNSTKDFFGQNGERSDNRNLIEEWISSKANSKVVFNKQQLVSTNTMQTDHLMGIFASSHLAFNLDADKSQQPSLAEMTRMAIKQLKKYENGFFLFVESGLIDYGHHATKAHKALDETLELEKAVRTAYMQTDPEDTLIIVSADHGHTMTINGYPELDNNIMGINLNDLGDDNKPYTVLSYANGPSYESFYNVKDNQISRVDLRTVTNMGK